MPLNNINLYVGKYNVPVVVMFFQTNNKNIKVKR